jgi:cytochrome c oxidase cbb3-type subunit 3
LLSLAGTLIFLLSNRRVSGDQTTGHDYDGIQELDNPLPMWWVGMFVASILFAFGYLMYYPGLGNFTGMGNWSSESQLAGEVAEHEARFAPLYAAYADRSPEDLAGDRKAMQAARRLYINQCSTCHGLTAKGGFGFPNLTDAEWQWGDGYDAIKTTILRGRQAAMPPWVAALGEDGIQDTANFVRKIAGLEHDKQAAERGQKHYQTVCVACHGVEGKGNPALGAPSLVNDAWLYGSSTAEIAFTLRYGRNGNMPAHEDLLGADRIHLLTSYVMTLDDS